MSMIVIALSHMYMCQEDSVLHNPLCLALKFFPSPFPRCSMDFGGAQVNPDVPFKMEHSMSLSGL